MSLHAARHHDAAVAACTQLSNKKGETSAFTALLDQLRDTELLGAIITAEALHTVADHATYLRKRGAHYLIYVKGNRPRLHTQLSCLPWPQIPVAHTQGPTHAHAHGREEHRSVKVTAVTGLAFPGARQVVRIERHRREHGKAKGSREVVFAVTDLDAHQVSPAELAGPRSRSLDGGEPGALRTGRDLPRGRPAHPERGGPGGTELFDRHRPSEAERRGMEEHPVRAQNPHRQGQSSRPARHQADPTRMDLNRENSGALRGSVRRRGAAALLVMEEHTASAADPNFTRSHHSLHQGDRFR